MDADLKQIYADFNDNSTNSSASPFFSQSADGAQTLDPMHADTPQIQRSTAELIEILIYSLCLCVGGPLNLLSFRRLIRQLRRPSPPSSSRAFGSQLILLKLHLNIADLITMFVYTLSQIIWMITYQWHAGDFLCRLIKFFHTFSFYLNSFIVACFAIDRFLGTRNLNNPSATNVARTRVKRMLAFAWLWATLLSAPQCFIFRVFEPSELTNFKQCTPIWTILGYELDLKLGMLNETDAGGRTALIDQFERVVAWERVYNMTHLLFLFWIPSLLIATSYAAILVTLNSLSVVPGSIKCHGVVSFRRQQKKEQGNENGDEIGLQQKEGEEDSNASTLPGNGIDDEGRQPLRNGKSTVVDQPPKNGGMMLKKGSKESADWGDNGAGAASKIGFLAAQTIAKARQNAKRQAALILAAYLTFWSPYNLLAIINAWAQKEGAIREISSASLPFLNSLIVVNPIVNPLIYGVFDDCRQRKL